MSKKVDDAAEQADSDIMQRCEPEMMSPEEACDYLGQVIDRCQEALDALEEEREDDPEDD